MTRAAEILKILNATLALERREIAERFGVSERSIDNDVHALNDRLRRVARIETDGRGRLHLRIADTEGFLRLQEELESPPSLNDPAHRQAAIFALLDAAPAQRAVPIDEICRAVSVSRTTAAKDIAALRQTLSLHGMRVEARTKRGYWLVGSELSRRRVLLSEFFTHLIPPAPAWVHEETVGVAKQFDLDIAVRANLERWVRVLAHRAERGAALGDLPGEYEGLVGTPAHAVGAALLERVQARCGTELGSGEALFLATPLATARPRDVDKPDTPGTDVEEQLATEIIARIRSEMDIGFAVDELDLLRKFTNHLAFLLNRMRYQVRLDVAVPSLEQSYPTAFRMARIAKSAIEEYTGGVVLPDELSLIAAYFQVFLQELSKQQRASLKVALVTRDDGAQNLLLAARLREALLPAKDPTGREALTVLTPAQFREREQEFHLAVAPVGLAVDSRIPLLHLQADFDAAEFSAWVAGAVGHQRWGAAFSSVDAVIARLVTAERFFVLAGRGTYEEHLRFMLEQLVARSLIPRAAAAGVLERERAATMRMNDYLAFPHLAHPSVDSIEFAVGLIPRAPADPGLRVIFLLIVPASVGEYDQLIVEIYDEILRLSTQPDKLTELSAARTISDYFFFFSKGA